MSESILLVVPGYPSDQHPYNNMFVHSRVKAYLQHGLKIDVFSVGMLSHTTTYEGVSVRFGTLGELKSLLQEKSYPKILIHFAMRGILKVIAQDAPKTPLIIWVHGYEALSWKRRAAFFDVMTLHRLIGYFPVNLLQRRAYRDFIQTRTSALHFVFVSQWMKDVFAQDIGIDMASIKASLIPNAIDTESFVYHPKDPQQRFKLLSIRPYTSKKYANDLAIDAVLKLSQNEIFNQLTFTFVGKGRSFKTLTKPLQAFPNVTLRETYLNHQEIIALHQTHGIMLIPTRQDSQGVSMGEAMSSGLVPIASNNTAIPEFLDERCGYLTNNAQEIADAILELVHDPDLFCRKSAASSLRVSQQCGSGHVIQQELDLILSDQNSREAS